MKRADLPSEQQIIVLNLGRLQGHDAEK